MSNSLVSAGLVDLQVNGFAGVDFNDTAISPKALDQALEAMLATGVTCCLPTVITAPEPLLRARLRALDTAVAHSRLGPLMCPGFHLEGPFLNPADGYSGCHPADAMGAPDPALPARLEAGLSRPILLLTLAAELPGAVACIRAVCAEARLVAIGHSAADFAEVAAAADAGAMLSTHLGNGLPQRLPKLDNPLFAQLAEDRLSAGFIADGIHLPPPALRVMLRAKGGNRAFLVTDATAAAAAQPGCYPFAGMMVERSEDGTVRQGGGRTLAGSSLCMDAALRNLLAWGAATPRQALRLASDIPAALLAPVLAARGIALLASEAEWSPSLHLRRIRLGSSERRFPDPSPPERETCQDA